MLSRRRSARGSPPSASASPLSATTPGFAPLPPPAGNHRQQRTPISRFPLSRSRTACKLCFFACELCFFCAAAWPRGWPLSGCGCDVVALTQDEECWGGQLLVKTGRTRILDSLCSSLATDGAAQVVTLAIGFDGEQVPPAAPARPSPSAPLPAVLACSPGRRCRALRGLAPGACRVTRGGGWGPGGGQAAGDGLRREWFQLVAKEVSDPGFNLFCSYDGGRTLQPSPTSDVQPLDNKYFELIGKVPCPALPCRLAPPRPLADLLVMHFGSASCRGPPPHTQHLPFSAFPRSSPRRGGWR